jgi:hypothetical protein
METSQEPSSMVLVTLGHEYYNLEQKLLKVFFVISHTLLTLYIFIVDANLIAWQNLFILNIVKHTGHRLGERERKGKTGYEGP